MAQAPPSPYKFPLTRRCWGTKKRWEKVKLREKENERKRRNINEKKKKKKRIERQKKNSKGCRQREDPFFLHSFCHTRDLQQLWLPFPLGAVPFLFASFPRRHHNNATVSHHQQPRCPHLQVSFPSLSSSSFSSFSFLHPLFCKWIMESELIHSPLFTWTIELEPTISGPDQTKMVGLGPTQSLLEKDLLGQHRPNPFFGLILAQIFSVDLNPISFGSISA